MKMIFKILKAAKKYLHPITNFYVKWRTALIFKRLKKEKQQTLLFSEDFSEDFNEAIYSNKKSCTSPKKQEKILRDLQKMSHTPTLTHSELFSFRFGQR